MAGFARMHKQGRRSGGRQRGGDLAADVPAFAHAHDNHVAPARQNQAHRLGKFAAQAAGQAQHRRGFYLNGFPGESQCLGGIKVRGIKAHASIL